METKWIKYSDQKPEKGRLFVVKQIGCELNTNWKLKVWNLDTFERVRKGGGDAEYLYIS